MREDILAGVCESDGRAVDERAGGPGALLASFVSEKRRVLLASVDALKRQEQRA